MRRLERFTPVSSSSARTLELVPISVKLRVETPNQRPVMEYRQRVVAKLPLGRWCIDFDPVSEAEEVLGALSLPEQRIEGTEQRRPDGVRQRAERLDLLGQAVKGSSQTRHLHLDDPSRA